MIKIDWVRDFAVDITGASFILFFGKLLIKLVPTRYGEDLPHPGDAVSIQINACKNKREDMIHERRRV